MAQRSNEELAAHAREVLEANWLGHATSPSVRLYPHQWSWDSAFVAIGYTHHDEERARTELESLFAGQWADGMLPHIVFVADGPPYFPGPEIWRSEQVPAAPDRPRTSGIIQPPVHATATWHVYRHSRDRDAARTFLARMLPRLAAWHDYLHRERTRNGSPLAEIWHPWESGMDNSPLWDGILARISPAESVPAYQRTDLQVAEATERPTGAEYDRYIHLVNLFRESGYNGARIRTASPFAVRDVLFNALLVRADHDLAQIAEELGEPADEYRDRAGHVAKAVDTELWSDEHSSYLDADVVTGELIDVAAWSRFSPLFAGIPDGPRAARVVDELIGSTVPIDGVGLAVPTLPPSDARFEPTLYWRGQVWINANWLLYHGLRRYGFTTEASALRKAMIELARRGGFSEHYHPITGRGHGGTEFAWSAALVLDLLHQD
jgi:glycogen debranching enzyme